ncbi:MAG: tRNA pseudouridine(13) synthase TruD [Candidatus Aenigmarchaeota archaeon]|nr:tRNA pseudouridine(13) synthase TruD [Candidatus Aenigmarchaeota archaeon]
MDWKIKENPEDFVVKEVIFDRTEESWKEKMQRIRGNIPEKKERYLWFTLMKKNRDFFTVIGELGSALRISTKDIGYSGTKDRKAVTYQTISVPIEKEKEVRSLKIKGVVISDFRSRNRPIKLGEHKGNAFEIVIRNVSDEKDALAEKIERMKKDGMINYFGEQRFGSVSGANHIIGKLLVKGDFKNAAEIMTETDGSYERKMSAYLKKFPGDYTGAIKQLPLRMVKMFVHAYQSNIWNKCAVRYDGDNTAIPIVGHKTVLKNYPKVNEILNSILVEEDIYTEEFGNTVLRELSSRGTEREYLVFPKDFTYSFSADRKHKGRKIMKLSFFLPKGSYATEVIRQLSEA